MCSSHMSAAKLIVHADCRTTLHWAALGSAVEAWPSLVGARYGSNVETAQLLLKAGAEVKSRDDAGCSPMHYAAGQPDYASYCVCTTQHAADMRLFMLTCMC